MFQTVPKNELDFFMTKPFFKNPKQSRFYHLHYSWDVYLKFQARKVRFYYMWLIATTMIFPFKNLKEFIMPQGFIFKMLCSKQQLQWKIPLKCNVPLIHFKLILVAVQEKEARVPLPKLE